MFIRKEIPLAVSAYSILYNSTQVPPVLSPAYHKYLKTKVEKPLNKQIFPTVSKTAFLSRYF